MASGVAVNQECIEAWQRLKLGVKGTQPLRYIVFTLNKNWTEIVVEKLVEKVVEKGSTGEDPNVKAYHDFVEGLPTDQCRWIAYDFEYDLEDAGKRNKLVFIAWSPGDAAVRQKMVFATSKGALQRSLAGIAIVHEATDHDGVSYESLRARMK